MSNYPFYNNWNNSRGNSAFPNTDTNRSFNNSTNNNIQTNTNNFTMNSMNNGVMRNQMQTNNLYTNISPRINIIDREQKVRENGTYSLPKNFVRKTFEDGSNNTDGRATKLTFATCASIDDYEGFSLEEIRYIDYQLSKNKSSVVNNYRNNFSSNINNSGFPSVNNMNNNFTQSNNSIINTNNKIVNNINGVNQFNRVGTAFPGITSNTTNDLNKYLVNNSGMNNNFNSNISSNKFGINNLSNTNTFGNNNFNTNSNFIPGSVSGINSNVKSSITNNFLNNNTSLSKISPVTSNTGFVIGGNLNNGINRPNTNNTFGSNNTFNSNNIFNPNSNNGIVNNNFSNNLNNNTTNRNGMGLTNNPINNNTYGTRSTSNIIFNNPNKNVQEEYFGNNSGMGTNNFIKPNNTLNNNIIPNNFGMGNNINNMNHFNNMNNINNVNNVNNMNNFNTTGNKFGIGNNLFSPTNNINNFTNNNSNIPNQINPLQNNQFYNPLNLNNINDNTSIKNNFNFNNNSTNSGIFNSGAKIPFNSNNSINSNNPFMGGVQGMSTSNNINNLIVPNSFINSPQNSNNNQFYQNPFNTNKNVLGQSTMTNFNSISNSNNVTNFNNPQGINTYINQQRNMLNVNEVMGNSLNKYNNNFKYINQLNPNQNLIPGDYLGIKALCLDVNSKLNSNFNFSKKDIDEIMDFSCERKEKIFNDNNLDYTYNSGKISSIEKGFGSGSINFHSINKSKIGDGGLSSSYTNNFNNNNLNNTYSKDNFFQTASVKNNNLPLNNFNNNNYFNTTNKKSLTIEEILPMKNNLKEDNKNLNILEMSENRNGESSKYNNNFSKTEPHNYYKSQEFFSEIDHLAEEAHKKTVGPIINNINKNESLTELKIPRGVSLTSNKLNLNTGVKNTNGGFNFKYKSQDVNLNLNNNNSSNYNNLRRPVQMNSIPESNEEVKDTPIMKRTQYGYLTNTNSNLQNLLNPEKINQNLSSKFEDINSLTYSNNINNSIFRSPNVIKKSPIVINLSKSNNKQPNYTLDNGLLNLHFKIEKPVEFEFHVKVNKKNKAIDLKGAIEEILREKYPDQCSLVTSEQICIFSKQGVIKDTDIIEKKEFLRENEVLYVFLISDDAENNEKLEQYKVLESEDYDQIIEEEDFKISNIRSDFENVFENGENDDNYSAGIGTLLNYKFINNPNNNINNNSSNNSNLNPVPICTKFETIPSLNTLKNITNEDLQKVENFTIMNENGRIQFKGLTDVSYLNLDEIVKIEPLCVNLYQNVPLPEIATKLNKPAIITIFGMEEDGFQDSEEAYAEFLEKVKHNLKDKNSHYINYDPMSKDLTFEVENFEINQLN